MRQVIQLQPSPRRNGNGAGNSASSLEATSLRATLHVIAPLSFSWLSDLLERLKELISFPEQPVLVPIPVRNRPRQPMPRPQRR